ncbi:NADH-FMN oxidoreductase RutF, flavin reductase (DIM6/NTAB) family [Lutimaribacter pacificus]|uniref:NADH-FMN oxidoreductase RutF, flavin reductase (DIM6/NTAB) family n=1 Tax=Lutimaribacter pacificus TaxID=391948 RepID=A0A1H0L6E5_9RHOB|nr:flavin reductase family protein [Lutimaribacter pacificus]SDO63809.1 NADH-FMN oxidoreductase RutF, flavin reductase (DIM6/NTAB) family [Lutimaribacter pacificus]SHK70482.1 NADH-FMN oxidoreductase RutF, flavin reductase (DIM6/NTAB) family [Lutimaribacter pacificus]
MLKPDRHPEPFDEPPSLSHAFREAFRCHPAGVAIVSADAGTGPVALTVSSLISVSAAPPIVAFSLSAQSSSAEALLSAETAVIHLLRFEDLDLARLAATPGMERFGPDVAWDRLPGGEPRYTDIRTWFRARLHSTMPLDAATLVVAELLEGAVAPVDESPERDSLIYLDRRWHRLEQPETGEDR